MVHRLRFAGNSFLKFCAPNLKHRFRNIRVSKFTLNLIDGAICSVPRSASVMCACNDILTLNTLQLNSTQPWQSAHNTQAACHCSHCHCTCLHISSSFSCLVRIQMRCRQTVFHLSNFVYHIFERLYTVIIFGVHVDHIF